MEARSECPVTWDVTSRSSAYNQHSAIRYPGVVVQRQIYGRAHPANVPEILSLASSFLMFILGFPCLSLAYRPSPLRCRYEFYEPDAEESHSIKVTLSALPESLRPHPCKDNGSLFQSSKKTEYAVKSLVRI